MVGSVNKGTTTKNKNLINNMKKIIFIGLLLLAFECFRRSERLPLGWGSGAV
jgi:hypothetical protein